MKFLIRNIFLIYGTLGTIVAAVFLVQSNGSWTLAMESGGQNWLFSILLISMAMTGGLGHLFFGDLVVEGQKHEHNHASRMFQWELGGFCLIIALVAMVVPLSGQVSLALAWSLFVLAAGVRHVVKKEPVRTWVGDFWAGGILLACCLPAF